MQTLQGEHSLGRRVGRALLLEEAHEGETCKRSLIGIDDRTIKGKGEKE